MFTSRGHHLSHKSPPLICLLEFSIFHRSSPPLFHFLFFLAAHTRILSFSYTLIRSLSLPLSLSLVNHHNYRRNSGRIYRRKTIGDFLGSICFQYFKLRTLNLWFLYFVSFFTNLSNLSVICDLI